MVKSSSRPEAFVKPVAAEPKPARTGKRLNSWRLHTVCARAERKFAEHEIALLREDESDPNDAATAICFFGQLRLEEREHVMLTLSKEFQRRGAFLKGDEVTWFMGVEDWPHFVAMVNQLDKDLADVQRRNA